MAVKWEQELLKAGEEVLRKGGKLEFIVLKREKAKRIPIINKFLDNQVICDEEEIFID